MRLRAALAATRARGATTVGALAVLAIGCGVAFAGCSSAPPAARRPSAPAQPALARAAVVEASPATEHPAVVAGRGTAQPVPERSHPVETLATPSTGDVLTPVAGAVWQALPSGGLDRHYLLAAPTLGNGPAPLLLLLHGLNQHTATFVTATGILAAARAAGVVVAAPESPDASWNDGRFGPAGRNDDAFLVALVQTLAARGLVDPTRVTVAGFSNGAGMAMELVARHPAMFAGLVSVSGTLVAAPDAPRPRSPMAATFLHGTSDPIQPWDGRRQLTPRMPAQVGEEFTVGTFATAAGVAGHPALTTLPHTRGPGVVEVTRYAAAAAPTVTLYTLRGAGHVWPVTSCRVAACTAGQSFTSLSDVDATTLAVRAAATLRRGAGT